MKRILGCFAALLPEPMRGTWRSGTLASASAEKLDTAMSRDLARFMVILGILKREKWICCEKCNISARMMQLINGRRLAVTCANYPLHKLCTFS